MATKNHSEVDASDEAVLDRLTADLAKAKSPYAVPSGTPAGVKVVVINKSATFGVNIPGVSDLIGNPAVLSSDASITFYPGATVANKSFAFGGITPIVSAEFVDFVFASEAKEQRKVSVFDEGKKRSINLFSLYGK